MPLLTNQSIYREGFLVSLANRMIVSKNVHTNSSILKHKNTFFLLINSIIKYRLNPTNRQTSNTPQLDNHHEIFNRKLISLDSLIRKLHSTVRLHSKKELCHAIRLVENQANFASQKKNFQSFAVVFHVFFTIFLHTVSLPSPMYQREKLFLKMAVKWSK